ncbi:xanthine dehydrogenase family protein subunit M [Kibdelosporangium philippinense]|uniref:Xanthine dehydrogenase family protein subunit M n=1 Tax=Kibdelosporangium philippinense TaxID=211113 RepID=A0ABS8ZTB8_9PSEU|nr:xanthine dehydrogenase family protein subunit M [Kibdelosporangium philippinense]MCE7010973.1 xanthine dehydrogenase family protein subunit M [Kibdelosporangium philippinense]
MRNFTYAAPRNVADAVRLAGNPDARFIAGGTDLLNLMKDGAQSHGAIIDINGLPLGDIVQRNGVIRIGALARMSDVAAHPAIRRSAPVVSEALLNSASPQVRNMAAVGGNVLQRTRCGYFRDSGTACNKKVPGSGCPALEGENRGHAILGGSDHCIAVHPSDLAVSLLAVDAVVLTDRRRIPFADFHVVPGATPDRETVLGHGELITAFEIPVTPLTARSRYLKLRDRATFEFAVVSVAAALDMRGNTVRDIRLTFGGVATKPWRAPEAETALRGKPLTTTTITEAGRALVRGAVTRDHNAFKVELVQRALDGLLRDLGGVR